MAVFQASRSWSAWWLASIRQWLSPTRRRRLRSWPHT